MSTRDGHVDVDANLELLNFIKLKSKMTRNTLISKVASIEFVCCDWIAINVYL